MAEIHELDVSYLSITEEMETNCDLVLFLPLSTTKRMETITRVVLNTRTVLYFAGDSKRNVNLKNPLSHKECEHICSQN